MSNTKRTSADRLRQAGQDIDGDYFSDNPRAILYTRPATRDELTVTGYPHGTMVRVHRRGCFRYREFIGA